MATIKLEDAMKLAAADAFWAIRGKAIQAYASLEQSMAMLFSVLAGTDRETTNIIFFKIASADARNKIIEKLFQRKFGTEYNLFRNSLVKQLGPIDRERNEVVHWNVVNQVGADADGNTTSILILMPPANWVGDINTPRKLSEDLITFSRKCDFYARLITGFCVYVGKHPDMPGEVFDLWIPLFQQAIVYPPPDEHLLKRPDESLSGPNNFHVGTGESGS